MPYDHIPRIIGKFKDFFCKGNLDIIKTLSPAFILMYFYKKLMSQRFFVCLMDGCACN
jgi:hypothetical protein